MPHFRAPGPGGGWANSEGEFPLEASDVTTTRGSASPPIIIAPFGEGGADFPAEIRRFSRCSMPLSLAKMPTAARQALSSLINLFSASTSDHRAATGERRKKPNLRQITPEPARRESTSENRMNGSAAEVVGASPPHRPNHGAQASASCSPPSSSGASSDMDHWEPDDYEKELVKRTWSDDFDFLYELGTNIYQHIFDTNPHTKELFPSIHRHGADWKHSKEFRSQALKFVQTLSQTVKNLYHMDLQKVSLQHIGARHVQYADRGFKPEYWDVFQDSIEFATRNHIAFLADLNEQQKVDATNVWRTLALYVTTHMKKGYFNALENRKHDSK